MTPGYTSIPDIFDSTPSVRLRQNCSPSPKPYHTLLYLFIPVSIKRWSNVFTWCGWGVALGSQRVRGQFVAIRPPLHERTSFMCWTWEHAEFLYTSTKAYTTHWCKTTHQTHLTSNYRMLLHCRMCHLSHSRCKACDSTVLEGLMQPYTEGTKRNNQSFFNIQTKLALLWRIVLVQACRNVKRGAGRHVPVFVECRVCVHVIN